MTNNLVEIKFATTKTNNSKTKKTNNCQLVTAGYFWVVVPVERRHEYLVALEQESVEENIERLVRFIGSLMWY